MIFFFFYFTFIYTFMNILVLLAYPTQNFNTLLYTRITKGTMKLFSRQITGHEPHNNDFTYASDVINLNEPFVGNIDSEIWPIIVINNACILHVFSTSILTIFQEPLVKAWCPSQQCKARKMYNANYKPTTIWWSWAKDSFCFIALH